MTSSYNLSQGCTVFGRVADICREVDVRREQEIRCPRDRFEDALPPPEPKPVWVKFVPPLQEKIFPEFKVYPVKIDPIIEPRPILNPVILSSFKP